MDHEDFVERRIQQGQRSGAFDKLPGQGKPISDLGTERPEGWWADNYIRLDKARRRLVTTYEEVRREKAAAWRQDDHAEFLGTMLRLNQRLIEANDEVDQVDQLPLYDIEAESREWLRRRRARKWPDHTD